MGTARLRIFLARECRVWRSDPEAESAQGVGRAAGFVRGASAPYSRRRGERLP
jgi:hypothetical protein